MPPVQTAYSENIPVGYAGMVVDMTQADVVSRVCETAAGLAFGVAVSQGTNDNGVLLGGSLTDLLGITVRDVTLDPSAADVVPQYANLGVLVKGDIWVVAAAAITVGDPVHYDTTTGLLTNTGGIGPIVGARWMRSAASGALGVVRLSGGLP